MKTPNWCWKRYQRTNEAGLVWFGLLGLFGISTFVGYLTPNPFLSKYSVLFKTIQFSMSTQFNYQKHFYFKQFKQLYITIMISTVSMSKKVQFKTIQFSKSTQFKCKYSWIVKKNYFRAIQFSQTILLQLIQFSKSTDFVNTQLHVSSMLNNSV